MAGTYPTGDLLGNLSPADFAWRDQMWQAMQQAQQAQQAGPQSGSVLNFDPMTITPSAPAYGGGRGPHMIAGEQMAPGQHERLLRKLAEQRLREEAQIATLGGQIAPWDPRLLRNIPAPETSTLPVVNPRVMARKMALRRPRPDPMAEARAAFQQAIQGL